MYYMLGKDQKLAKTLPATEGNTKGCGCDFKLRFDMSSNTPCFKTFKS